MNRNNGNRMGQFWNNVRHEIPRRNLNQQTNGQGNTGQRRNFNAQIGQQNQNYHQNTQREMVAYVNSPSDYNNAMSQPCRICWEFGHIAENCLFRNENVSGNENRQT